MSAGGVGGRRGRGLTVAHGIALAGAIPLRGSRSVLRVAVRRAPRSPSLPRPGRAASTGAASLVAALRARSPASGALCPTFPSSADGSTTNSPRPRHPPPPLPSSERLGGGGCSGDRRVKAPIVLLDEQRWRRARLLVRRSEGSTASFIGRSVATCSAPTCSASAWSRQRSRGDNELLALNLRQLGCHERWRRVAGVGNVCGGAVG